MFEESCDILILGATFAAAGILAVMGDRAIVVESRPDAGYEFFGALRTGTSMIVPTSVHAKELQKSFSKRTNLRACTPLFYEKLKDRRVLLSTKLLVIERLKQGYAVTVCGASGKQCIFAKQVVDTRPDLRFVEKKSLNVLFYPERTERIPLPIEADMIEARKILATYIANIPNGEHVLAVADEFDYDMNLISYIEENGIQRLHSAGFTDPIAAFDAGVLLGEGCI